MGIARHRLRGLSRRVRIGVVVAAAAAVVGGSLAAPHATAVASAAPADPDGNWVGAWAAAPQGPSTLGQFGAETLSGTTQATALQKIVPPPTTFSDETIRQIMYLHHGGHAVRIQLSNEFGTTPAQFPSVTVGKRAGDSGAAVAPGTLRTVTFDGSPSVTIPVGGTAMSDPVDLSTDAFDHLVLSIFVPSGNGPATVHGNSMQTFFTGPGDTTGQESSAYTEHGIVANRFTSTFTTAEYYATGIQVEGDEGDRTLVAFGDSITDGFLSDGNTDGRYPDDLARRLQADDATRNLSVVNEAISGGRVTGDGIGPSALKRLQSQVLDQPNLAGVIFLEGINDLGTAILQDLPKNADDLIAAYKQIAAAVHEKGVPIYIGTLTPAGDLLRPAPYGVYSSPQAVADRNKVNTWLRTEGRQYIDGVIDFDAAIRSPLDPNQIDLTYDAGDDLHPNQLGYQLMSDSIPQGYLDHMAG